MGKKKQKFEGDHNGIGPPLSKESKIWKRKA